jgi:UDP-glucose 4-epimerase
MKKKVLVTGAAGFIGAAVARQFQVLGFEVFTIDNLSTGFEKNIPEGVVFIRGNVYDSELIDSLLDNSFEAIVHIAGQSSGEISFDDPQYDLNTNTLSTLCLLKLAVKTGCKKFIYASTMSVYGDQTVMPVTENASPSPQSFYAVGKLASEHYLKIYSQKENLSCTALRLFNVYGPGQNMENMRQGMASIFMSQAIQNHSIHVKGDGNRFRDFVYIDDVVNAFLKSYLDGRSGYSCFNVCSEIKTRVDELVDIIVETLGDKKIQIKFEGKTAGDIFGIIGSNQKINTELSWRPKMNLRNGINEMYKWAQGNSGHESE